jgi:acetylglutamate kinase
MKLPRGFSFAGVHAGIKASRKDLALVWSDAPCAAAGAFTVNAARAAPVRDAASRLPASGMRAIVVNSGNANALTGKDGDADVLALRDAFGAALGVPGSVVLTASTGVIGVRLPVKKLCDAAPALAAARGPAIEAAAEAIMTTDTRIKLGSRTVRLGGQTASLAAFAKGSGMIAPELATVLVFVATDAAITPGVLAGCVHRAAARSFNHLTVDDDMSTNDAAIVLANGLAENPLIEGPGDDLTAFEDTLEALFLEMARAIAEDGEGASKLLTVHLAGAPDDAIARDLAKAVTGSNLVKTAVFGADPNWGRVLAAVGSRIGSRKYDVDPLRATVRIQGVTVFEKGGPAPLDPLALKAKMRQPEVMIEVHLEQGPGTAQSFGCDLSYDYVKINADYASFTSASAEGVVAKDDRLTNYSPSFKRTLVVEALTYISKFKDKRTVIKYGGAAMVKDSLKAGFANDVNLLLAAGLLPIVVHGGGPEITRTLDKLGGKKSEFIDGVRVTDSDDMKVVEMVLTGKVNTEIVSLLNRETSRAVGVSGKDAGLLRARKLLSEDGRDIGRVGEITHVNIDFLDVLLSKKYVPVVSPIGLGDDGEGYNINADTAAAEIAVALNADKLIYITDVPGVLVEGELVSELTASEARRRMEDGTIRGGMVAKVKSILGALERGVKSVHMIDGRAPHTLIAELFTDKGVGTMVRLD